MLLNSRGSGRQGMRGWRRWGSGFFVVSPISFRQAVSARSAAWRPRNCSVGV
ncbi:hypothetical protein PF005_g5925 [Phytophthora fragariae]|uniref:Uncharacterized protein n=1 Tax=Phytophthora fragariae TaxID=53985 RepID=A0A6A3YU51_9STRA|nr:hypothetical protein PF003_g6618 [Phytophthora fragariae]KAE8943707.1 hypothetical protein PF009_g6584 [Phytophthora fragariae]KAE9021233.1 hypothetical protein PF011_g5042 [Phytophthora fragariae]KAE9126154.1 hypothetical protein PF007_g6088 [Phytophthora fragariae]KAE9126401.1 hypothetical protein PF010_g5282 [Phytophthora fragariae]